MMRFFEAMAGSKGAIIAPEDALPGRPEAMPVADAHLVLGNPMAPPFPEGFEQAVFGMGCFWGAERIFWQLSGVWTTAVGYAGGYTPNPTYEEACSAQTGHMEAVLVFWDPSETSYEEILRAFWEGHDPTQGMRQGADHGTQYRSAAYWTTEEQRIALEASRDIFQGVLTDGGFGDITTEIRESSEFYYAEPYHQQFLHWNPNGYCGIGGTGMSCPAGVVTAD